MEYTQHVFQSDQELPDIIRWQALSFLRIHFPEGFLGENENRDWINSPLDQSIHIALTTENLVLISYCSVVRKTLIHRGMEYQCWGMTGVMTYPPFRNRGFGKKVVDIATGIINESGCDIGMFHCSKDLKSFYERSGWEAMEGTQTLIGDSANPEISDELMMMRFISENAKSNRDDFVNEEVYFGQDTW